MGVNGQRGSSGFPQGSGLELELFNVFVSDLQISELTVFASDPRLFQLTAFKTNCVELHDTE